ncbi:MAG: hypothetical protein FD130_2566 [Halothiobacillaceae bacterium]|nr:MAG: hypothetical protein FD130_2566 [Halothiobacillaceae bacterium]
MGNALLMRPACGLALVTWLYAQTNRRNSRLFAVMRRLIRGAARSYNSRIFALATGCSLAAWLAECLAMSVALTALGSQLALATVVFIYAVSSLVGALSLLPGGLGGFEAVCITLLMAQSVELPVAIAATAVVRATTLWLSVALGFWMLPLVLRPYRRVSTIP